MSFIDTSMPSSDNVIDSLTGYTLFSPVGRNVGGIVFDVTVEEVHDDSYEITQNPIQTGAVVTDHSFALPCRLTVRGGASDSTLGIVGYAQEMYDAFQQLAADRQPFSVLTGRRYYQNMVVKRLGLTTDKDTENCIICTVELQQLTFASASPTRAALGISPTAANHAFPSETAPSTDGGQKAVAPLPYFASTPAGYTPPSPISSGGGGSLPFFASGNVPG